MNERRQRRAAFALISGLTALGILMLSSGCDMRPSLDSAQTAIAVAQTVVPGVQTALPGFQATAQAGATVVSGALANAQAISAQLQAILGGVQIDVSVTPNGAANDAVTEVSITGTDARGSFSQLDSTTRQTAAMAALLIAAQYYPNATISLSVVNNAGNAVISGTKAPNQSPSVQ